MSTQLGSGYLELTVKLASAQSEIAKQFNNFENQAKKSGKTAGNALSQGLGQSRLDGSDAKRMFSPIENAAKSSGKEAGDSLAGGITSSLRSKLSGARESFSGITDSASSAGEGAGSSFATKFGSGVAVLGRAGGPIGAALAAAGAVAAAAGAVVVKEFMAGAQRQADGKKLQAALGLDEATMQSVSKSVLGAYQNNFGESVQQLQDTAKTVVQNRLVDPANSAALQKVIEQVDTVASVTDSTADEISVSVSKILQGGLAKNAEEAFDLITVASQKGLNTTGDLFDTFTEYSVQFQKLGLDGKDALGIINQLYKGGARNTDLAADALKEFSIRAIDGSKATTTAYLQLGLNADDTAAKFAQGGDAAKQAFGDVAQRIAGIQDPLVRSQIQVALFGTQAEDLGKALGNINLDTAAQELGNVSGAAQNAANVLASGPQAGFQSLGRQLETLRFQFQDFLVGALGPTAQEFTMWVQNNIPNFIDGLTRIGSVVLTATDGVLGFFQFTMEWGGKWQQFMSRTLGEVIKQLGQFAVQSAGFLKLIPGMGDEAETLEKLGNGAISAVDGWRDLADGMQTGADAIGRVRESVRSARDDLTTYGTRVADAARLTQLLGNNVSTLPDGKTIVLNDNSAETQQKLKDLGFTVSNLPDGQLTIRIDYKDQNGQSISPDQLKGYKPEEYNNAGEAQRARRGYATGGLVRGPGSGTSDSILAWLSNGEGVVTANAMSNGGAALVAALNNGWTPSAQMLHGLFPGFAKGRTYGPDVSVAEELVGTPYSQPARYDCSGTVARVINGALGATDGNLMTTRNAKEWLTERGFVPGNGGPGTIRVGWYNKGNSPNDGHMAMTLSDGRNAESGGSSGPFTVGGGAAGANDPQFTEHMYLPQVYGEGSAGSSSYSPSGGGSSSGGSSGGGSSSGGGGSSSSNPFSQILSGAGQLADLTKDGLLESFLPAGFSNPLDGSLFKSGAGILNFAAGLTQDPAAKAVLGAFGGALSGSPSSVLSAFEPLFSGTNPEITADNFGSDVHQGTGAIPGPGNAASALDPTAAINRGASTVNNYDNSTHVGENGTVGMNPTEVFDRTARQQRANQNPQLSTRRFI